MLSEQIFNLHLATRTQMIHYLQRYSAEQLRYIPQGFKNNIFWNIAHCVATQQILCYRLCGAHPVIPEDFVELYKKDTFPNGLPPEQEKIQQLLGYLSFTQQRLEHDYMKGFFKEYTFSSYATSYGYILNKIEEAIHFNNVHEAMHLGTIKALAYFV